MRKKKLKKIIVVRGLPGAGKTTYVKAKGDALTRARMSWMVLSADDYFMHDGQYRFDPHKLGEAHADCLRRFVGLIGLFSDVEVIFVDNTNTTIAEMAPYVALGQAYGWDVKVVTIVATPAEAAKRNIHGVPSAVVDKLASNLVRSAHDIPPYWPHEYVHSHT